MCGSMKYHYYYIYKPYGTLSQFTSNLKSHQTLKQLFSFPSNVYPVGRLDRESEGLLLLTDDPSINTRLLHPRYRHARTYFAQVEGIPGADDLRKLSSGVNIKVNKKPYQTLPCTAEITEDVGWIPPRNPPIRFRKNIPTTWLKLELIEGKNRQVRKMCAAIGYPVLRLLRSAIEDLHIRDFVVGEVRVLSYQDVSRKLHLNH